MKILGIETSCDETGAAIVEDGRKILSNIVASSREIHDKTGGVIPEVAAREQIKCILPVINQSLQNADCKLQNLDAIAVTVGPGLIGSLLVGVETAKTLSYIYKKPLIPVNHIFAHIYANFLDSEQEIKFPAIVLVVSGGHTELFYMKDEKTIKWLGGTLDDASGEAFDKTARLLGLGYPGGPAIATAADKLRTKNYALITKLPRPMINSDDLNFSFSGLKTAVLREVNKLSNLVTRLPARQVEELAYEIQEAITDVLVKKTLDAVNKYKVKTVLLGGGVAANKRLTEKFKLKINPPAGGLKTEISLYVPPAKLCTDNGAVIASYAYFHPPAGGSKPWKDVDARPDLEVEV
ncbi:tRNA (adenosine(37)-N6)-threonylcarbamoyltransferase complex transferase subunit TsaD [Candidatus Gottesmanbacteria bacterium RIFCSPHIGHO2_01_FULL_39_10]|uniref:tRNA N6-adenosine threonylcarbamoyltransferase n=1 Tax=Candidatus Gottesmanbacteria bacterium RIFCSPHIGHO2_01_FULL_39_10 TaxID=1798375 RepID=A0A1F5ZPY9_9BACT|nr:MAG: tRNA (adenosine(37)-N6)-threonylcarbamoyltransferase complex transferase subunit TsaD [Candidatus Gottesmanbacteria bacterium RIFCSPHIGHO2_01_FULL_39_10]